MSHPSFMPIPILALEFWYDNGYRRLSPDFTSNISEFSELINVYSPKILWWSLRNLGKTWAKCPLKSSVSVILQACKNSPILFSKLAYIQVLFPSNFSIRLEKLFVILCLVSLCVVYLPFPSRAFTLALMQTFPNSDTLLRHCI